MGQDTFWLLHNVSQANIFHSQGADACKSFSSRTHSFYQNFYGAKWAAFSLYKLWTCTLGGLPREIPQWDCLTTEIFGRDTCLVIMSWNIRNPCPYTDDCERNLTHPVSPVFALLSTKRILSLKSRGTQHACLSILLIKNFLLTSNLNPLCYLFVWFKFARIVCRTSFHQFQIEIELWFQFVTQPSLPTSVAVVLHTDLRRLCH